jgi:hypothetical protein
VGALLQLKVIVPLKPAVATTCKSYVAACPGIIVALVEQLPPEGHFAPVAVAREKSGVLVSWPLRGAVCGLPPVLSEIESEAVSTVVSDGLNVTLMEQLERALNVAGARGQLLVSEKSDAFVPLMAIEEIVSAALPAFVRVIC